MQDNDNRVRDAAHRTLKSVVEVVKDSLGVHLCSVIGCWVSGMGDPHSPAASTAVVAFFAAFPQRQKQVETYQFCFKAIFSVRTIAHMCKCVWIMSVFGAYNSSCRLISPFVQSILPLSN